MTLTGKQKAALLLMNLDSTTAGELLRVINPAAVQDLAVELTYLEASGLCNANYSIESAQEFCNSLHQTEKFQVKDFLNELLNNALGQDKSQQIQSQIDDLLRKKDPFIQIRSAPVAALSRILQQQHPQVVAMVLSELSPKKSSDVLNMLSDEIRSASVSRMATKDMITPEAKVRIAKMITSRLEDSGGQEISIEQEGGSEEDSFRKIAIILRNLTKEIRDGMLQAIKKKDAKAPDMISKLMVIWDDLPLVADRSMQNGLRGIDSQVLALALTGADPEIQKKIKANISTRAAETLDEEMSLMSKPKDEEIMQAREQIVKPLRAINDEGELEFLEQ